MINPPILRLEPDSWRALGTIAAPDTIEEEAVQRDGGARGGGWWSVVVDYSVVFAGGEHFVGVGLESVVL